MHAPTHVSLTYLRTHVPTHLLPPQVMETLQQADDVVELTFARTAYADADNSWLDQVSQ